MSEIIEPSNNLVNDRDPGTWHEGGDSSPDNLTLTTKRTSSKLIKSNLIILKIDA
ncbi:hypothetical protein DAPPUDRAFT_240681 [Daphnia pulex]|uniref:Uncharacterized protein n=1 Tax=Daphnia pulex TaxID=6669 RepID=E9GC87_DAPPU|nr:hypothetical protein DAPPUDRAFT_240681 [Daphnia pulex]|eukprot:EFX82905.1 hypothetical protein DAPPUDRAFT_240681 [Daphnia pulex]